MNIAVISYNKFSKNSTLAHNNITEAILDIYPNTKVIDSILAINRNYDVCFDKIFVVNGMECFCEYRDKILPFIENSKQAKLYWCSNDYMLEPSKKIKEYLLSNNCTLLSTVDEEQYKNKWFTKYQYVNFNILTLNLNFNYKFIDKIANSIIYYGAFRKGRVFFFKKYFPFLKNLYVSTTEKNFSKFRDINSNINLINKFDFVNAISMDLAKYMYTIYLEDEKSNLFYCSPANRFYECISNGVLQLFDSSCVKTFSTYGIDISEFVVNDSEDILHKIAKINSDFYMYVDKQKLWVGKEEICKVTDLLKSIVFEGFKEDILLLYNKQKFW